MAKEREDLDSQVLMERPAPNFAKADTSGNGFIDIYELRAFLNHMDEPLAEPELQATFADIASEKGGTLQHSASGIRAQGPVAVCSHARVIGPSIVRSVPLVYLALLMTEWMMNFPHRLTSWAAA